LKKQVLKLLKENKEEYISGGEMCKLLNVSRTAVWKVINKLREEGYKIESVPSKGYQLIDDDQLRSDEELNILLESYTYFDQGFFYETVDSTNNVLKRKVKDNYNKNLVAVSAHQSKGKGRLGRVWESNEGLYMSYLIRPDIMPLEAAIFTQIAAAAVVKTFETISELDIKIKWPNDIVVNGKKICGILTELNAELNKVHYLIVGIGINLNQEVFNEDLQDIATSYKIETGKNLKIKDFLVPFIDLFHRLIKCFIEEKKYEEAIQICRKYSAIIGKKVNIINGDNKRSVTVLDLTKDGQLLVLNEKKEEEVVFFGEISIRGIDKDYI